MDLCEIILIRLECGPFSFHLNDEIARILSKKPHASEHSSYYSWSPITERILARIRNTLERWMQSLACSSISDGIVLLDGSLTSETPDTLHIVHIIRLNARSHQLGLVELVQIMDMLVIGALIVLFEESSLKWSMYELVDLSFTNGFHDL
ncbi:hypothetical protein KEJ39_05260 [Candidatus Bathyarchaeota archaeon]|nr:hypothetical protein [Candidatus Bathyarchaeota archaeon]